MVYNSWYTICGKSFWHIAYIKKIGNIIEYNTSYRVLSNDPKSKLRHQKLNVHIIVTSLYHCVHVIVKIMYIVTHYVLHIHNNFLDKKSSILHLKMDFIVTFIIFSHIFV